MQGFLSRRELLSSAVALATGAKVFGAAARNHLFHLSLAQGSLRRAFLSKQHDPLDFARIAVRVYGLDAVEYLGPFYKDKAKDADYLKELRKRADDNGVQSLLIRCDEEGAIGDADEKKRIQAVESHYRWVDAAKVLGCYAIRVNAQSAGSREEQSKLVADGLRRLVEFAAPQKIHVVLENGEGLSSDPSWLSEVIKRVDHRRCGFLPNFGNFGDGDRYKGVKELMPSAVGVCAKSLEFDAQGIETRTDYLRMMRVVVDAAYQGHVGIEYEGAKLSEPDGIRATKRLLDRVLEEMTR
jgi:L-ribulose-5-phosphate 3-epimerase